MALPKEPRQKMINMMYLVLTAMLALNVSAEILNAFKTVNNSITKANDVIDTKNNTSYTSFDELLKDPKTAEKAKMWQPFALEAKKLAADAASYIEGLKKDLKVESGLTVEDGVEVFKEDNIDAASRLMETKKKGEELYGKLEGFRTKLLGILDPAKFSDPVIQKAVADKKAELEKTLPLDLSIPKSQSGNLNNTWTTAYFRMTPTIAAITILSKFQNDIKNSEAQVVDFCLSQVGSVKVVFDEFQAFAGTNATYLMPGQELEITAGVGAFSKAAKPTVTVNGAVVPLNEEGVALYKTQVSGAGEHVAKVNINYTRPDGTTATVTRDVTYNVGVPSGSSVFLEKMNVMYIGVDNPLLISAGSAGSEKMSVSFSGGGTINKVGNDRYIAKPSQPGVFEVKVVVDGKVSSFPMRCKYLPDPVVSVGGSKGGAISAAQFKAQGGMIARLESEFDAPFQVVSYRLGGNGGAFQTYQEAANEGPRWSGNAASIVSRATPGSSIFFDAIRVKGPDGRVRELPGIFFNLK